jgi:hypothetical protein
LQILALDRNFLKAKIPLLEFLIKWKDQVKFNQVKKKKFWSNAKFNRKFWSTEKIKWNSIKWKKKFRSNAKFNRKFWSTEKIKWNSIKWVFPKECA